MKLKFTLVSFFNTSNIGDLLISKSLKDKVERYGDVRTVDYLGTGEVNKKLELNYNKNEYSNSLSSLKNKLKTILISLKLEEYALKLLDKKSSNKINDIKYENNIIQSDALIIGGGNMIFDLSPLTLSGSRFEYYINVAKEANKPIFAISLGIGPFQNIYQERKAVDNLAKCNYITFRDNRSYEIFKTHYPEYKNVSVSPDPVFQLPFSLNDNIEKDSVGVNIINTDVFQNNMNTNKVISDYISLINSLLEETKDNIIIFNTEAKDFSMCKEVYKKFEKNDRVKLVKIFNYEDLIKVYSSLSLLIGTRMHSLITAYSQGIPIIGLSWQDKVDAMFELIEDTNSVYQLENLDRYVKEIIEKSKSKINNPDNQKFQRVTRKLNEMDEINVNFLTSLSK